MFGSVRNFYRRNLQQRKQAKLLYIMVSFFPMSGSLKDHLLVLENGLATPDICLLDTRAAQ